MHSDRSDRTVHILRSASPLVSRGRLAAVSAGVVAALAASLLAPAAAQGVVAIERIGGENRYEVSALVSEKTFAPGVPVVYVASGAGFADALSASAVAGVRKGPVLLVSSSGIPPSVAAELTRLAPQRIVVAGGSASVSDATLEQLRAYSTDVVRVAGANRYEVSANLSAAEFRPLRPVVYVASGAVFPDALSGSAAAGRVLAPVLLTTRDSIPETVLAELERLQAARIVILGGTSTVSTAVEQQLAEIATLSTTRVSGADRYEVSGHVAAGFRNDSKVVYIASGQVFPDALSGSAAAIAGEAPVLLVRSDSIPEAIAAELGRLRPSRIVVLGGPASVADPVLEELRQYIGVRS